MLVKHANNCELQHELLYRIYVTFITYICDLTFANDPGSFFLAIASVVANPPRIDIPAIHEKNTISTENEQKIYKEINTFSAPDILLHFKLEKDLS